MTSRQYEVIMDWYLCNGRKLDEFTRLIDLCWEEK
jgi:hypothetical protein